MELVIGIVVVILLIIYIGHVLGYTPSYDDDDDIWFIVMYPLEDDSPYAYVYEVDLSPDDMDVPTGAVAYRFGHFEAQDYANELNRKRERRPDPPDDYGIREEIPL